MQSTNDVKESFRFLVWASLATLILWLIPYAGIVTFPIRLFVTFIHEAGHALATLLTFGTVNRIAIYWDGSGVTETIGGTRLMISSAGYLSTTLYGAMLILLLRRRNSSKAIALVTGILLLGITVLWGGNWLAWLTGLILGAGLIALSLQGKPKLVHIVMSFLGVQCVLNAVYDLFTLIYLSAFARSASTDAMNMSNATNGFIPAIVWALIWSAISVLMLATTLMVYYRSLKASSMAVATPAPMMLPDEFSKIIEKKF
ncbi:MAG: M50 family metallopeptidase [Acidobacteria bacterium]|nr:M50 family metallopeptidase [Acidobacteriota bacterium]